MMKFERTVPCLSLLLGAIACGDIPPPAIGELSLGLSSGFAEERYRLAQATFDIQGAAAEIRLSTEDDAEGDTLQRSLPEGDYQVQLLEGWQLERVAGGGAAPVRAELASMNPLPFSILAGERTTVTFQFSTLSGAPAPASSDGDLRIGIAVDGVSTPEVIITEVMKNPETLPDADGEWIELFNPGATAVELGGCTLARDDQTLALDASVSIAPGQFLTFANGDTPGFVPDVLYSGLTLPNSGAFTLRLSCGQQLLDQVALDPATPSQRAGRSLGLSGSFLDATSNDDPARWCEGSSSFNGDFGTPGAANPDCAS